MNNGQNFNTDDLKKGAQEALNDTKKAFKNLDVKNEAKATENFLKDFAKNPLTGVLNAVDNGSKNFTLAIVLMVIWIAAVVVRQLIFTLRFRGVGFLSIFQAALGPIFTVLILAGLVVVFTKGKSLTDMIAIVTIAKIPTIVGAVLSILPAITITALNLTMPIASYLTHLSVILLFFALRNVFKAPTESKFFMTFVKIYGLYWVANFILSFLGI